MIYLADNSLNVGKEDELTVAISCIIMATVWTNEVIAKIQYSSLWNVDRVARKVVTAQLVKIRLEGQTTLTLNRFN